MISDFKSQIADLKAADNEIECFGISHGKMARLKEEIAIACRGFWNRRGLDEPGEHWKDQIENGYRLHAGETRRHLLAAAKIVARQNNEHNGNSVACATNGHIHAK